ncbi:MAG: mechanosensitive ion channel [Gammaproteobacteria bacterium]|nr:mechanosensitive ion channel [Gammaproteobacteria bacterium]
MNKKSSFFLFLKSCLMVLCFIWSVPGAAVQDETSSKFIEYLAAEKVNLTLTNSTLRSSTPPITHETAAKQKTEVRAQQALVNAKVSTLRAFLVIQEKKKADLDSRLKHIKQSPSSASEAVVLQESVNQMSVLIQINAKAIELIESNLALVARYQKILDKREQQLILWGAAEKKNDVIQSKQASITELIQKRAELYEKNIKLEHQKKPALQKESQRPEHEGLLLSNNQEILLIDHQIMLTQWEMNLAEADYTFLSKPQELKALEAMLNTYVRADVQLEAMHKALLNMQHVLTADDVILSAEVNKQNVTKLITQMSQLMVAVDVLNTSVKKVIGEKQADLKKQRSAHQRFKDYKQVSMRGVMKQITQVPLQFYHYPRALFTKMLENYLWEDSGKKALFWAMLLSVLVLFMALRRLLRQVTQEKTRSRFSGHLYDGALLLIYRSLPQFLLVMLLMMGLLINQVIFLQAQLLFHLLLLWLVYRQFNGIARLVLLERVSDVPQHEMTLYRRFKWLFFMGAWATGLMIVGQELPLSLLLQDVFNRMFMLFLFAIAWVLWKSRDTFSELFYLWLHANKRPFRHLLSFLSYLIPLSLLTTALIGLFGYVHFAWTLARYQAYFLLVLSAYVLLRELLNDFLDLLSERMVSKLHNGWLWVEAIIKPLEKWLHFALLLLGVVIVFRGFKENWEFAMLTNIKTAGHYQIFSGAEVHITVFSVIAASIVLLVLIWLSKWTREFCYRWLYRRIVDASIRNSVSVFTQYTLILTGVFIFLRVLGVDLTGMGMVLGGLAVGMGFGLRDFASNIVGGLMLLIERPVREGDLITLGEYEGRVAHIGIRSMRVSSWDKMDVLIPNAETFNKPVTNWTHQDGVVRTVLPIKVNRVDDPALVRQLIFDVLDIIPGILKEPPFQVFLKNIDEALIEFEVRYFINIQLNLRVAVRSEVLLAIMAQFKAAGIHAPVPPFRVEIDTAVQGKDDNTSSPTQ